MHGFCFAQRRCQSMSRWNISIFSRGVAVTSRAKRGFSAWSARASALLIGKRLWIAALFLLVAGGTPALARDVSTGFALLLPEKIVVNEAPRSALNFTLDMLRPFLPPDFPRDHATVTLAMSTLEPFSCRAFPMQPPQSLTAVRFQGDDAERREHLALLEEALIYDQPGYKAVVPLPAAGAHHFVLQTKAAWQQEADRFVQHVSKVQVAALGSAEGWDKPTGLPFEILPLSRPFGLCAGMSFTGQVLREGKPVPGALVEIARLNSAVRPDMRPMPAPEQNAAPSPQKAKRPARPEPESPYQATQEIRADDRGIFTFACPLAGWWIFSASDAGDPLQDPEGRQKPLEIKTGFWVCFEPCRESPRR